MQLTLKRDFDIMILLKLIMMDYWSAALLAVGAFGLFSSTALSKAIEQPEWIAIPVTVVGAIYIALKNYENWRAQKIKNDIEQEKLLRERIKTFQLQQEIEEAGEQAPPTDNPTE